MCVVPICVVPFHSLPCRAVLLCCAVPQAKTSSYMCFAGATVQREYIALVEQSDVLAANPQGTITDPLMASGGVLQPATTLYKTLFSNDRVALLKLTPKTGKHIVSVYSPVLADYVYQNGKSACNTRWVHCGWLFKCTDKFTCKIRGNIGKFWTTLLNTSFPCFIIVLTITEALTLHLTRVVMAWRSAA